MKQLLAPILSNQEVMPGVRLLWVEALEIAAAAKPGQFAMARIGDSYDPLLRRPFSVHRVSKGGQVAFLYATWGRGSAMLARKGPGEAVDILGPLGRGFAIQREARHLLLVGGGMGIAPLVFLAEMAIAQGRSVTLILGAATAAQVYPSHLLSPEVELVVTTDDGSAGRAGLVTDVLPQYADWADQVFACGPLPMYRAMAAVLGDQVRRKSVQVLLEMPMACGLGACYGCAVDTRRGYRLCCKDGPRFELKDVV